MGPFTVCLISGINAGEMEVYTDMEQWAEIRRRVLTGQATKRQIMRETGMHWTTLEKILLHSAPPGYRQSAPRKKPKLGTHLEWIRDILDSDKGLRKKYRHSAMRIWERLCKERGFTGGFTVVREAIREIRRTSGEVYMPLIHRPGEAQVDFFEALAKMGGVLRKVHVFCMALPFSDMLRFASGSASFGLASLATSGLPWPPVLCHGVSA